MKMLFTAGLLKSNAEHNGVGLRIGVWLKTAHAKVSWQRFAVKLSYRFMGCGKSRRVICCTPQTGTWLCKALISWC